MTDEPTELTERQKGFAPRPGSIGNQRAQVIHGGAGAVQAIQQGRDFAGLAAQEQAQVENEIERDGVKAVVQRGAVRLETAARLYWSAMAKAAQDNDLEALDRYVSRFAWLASAAIRAFDRVRLFKDESKPTLGGLLSQSPMTAEDSDDGHSRE